jgi:thymidylate synthase ThyX
MNSNDRITAEIIADSTNWKGDRLTSFILVIPRIVLAEFNTHRAISRNSASSRAIPLKTMIKKVMKEPFIPIAFQKDHSGMQGTEYFTGFKASLIKQLWLTSRNFAVLSAKLLNAVGVTKQLANRILEPYLYHTIIATATEWENFIALRAHSAAEIHINDVALKMLDCLNKSYPILLKEGEWHVPFGERMPDTKLVRFLKDNVFHGRIPELGEDSLFPVPREEYAREYWALKVKIATARCARVSYLNFEGSDDYNKDVKLHGALASMGHWSPFEHCAQAMGEGVEDWSGNLRGFVQYRKTFYGENKRDLRLISKK